MSTIGFVLTPAFDDAATPEQVAHPRSDGPLANQQMALQQQGQRAVGDTPAPASSWVRRDDPADRAFAAALTNPLNNRVYDLV